MTCKTNERFALNTSKTKRFFEENNIVALKAKRDKNAEVDPFLEEIGNIGKGIPYYAVFRPGEDKPLQFDGIFFSSNQMINKIQPALGPSAATSNSSPGATAAPVASR